MSSEPTPDYELDDRMAVSSPAQLRAVADALRSTILDLLLERAATVAELAAAVARPKSTVAHHVNVLVDAGLLRVVRTRKVRAVDERYYGRTARTFFIGVTSRPGEDATAVHANALSVAAAESVPAHETDELRTILRHARIPDARAGEFWDRVVALADEFAQFPRGGERAYGFGAGLYPTDAPTLPDAPEP